MVFVGKFVLVFCLSDVKVIVPNNSSGNWQCHVCKTSRLRRNPALLCEENNGRKKTRQFITLLILFSHVRKPIMRSVFVSVCLLTSGGWRTHMEGAVLGVKWWGFRVPRHPTNREAHTKGANDSVLEKLFLISPMDPPCRQPPAAHTRTQHAHELNRLPTHTPANINTIQIVRNKHHLLQHLWKMIIYTIRFCENSWSSVPSRFAIFAFCRCR